MYGFWKLALEPRQFHCHMWLRGSGNKISVISRSEVLLPVLNKIFPSYLMTDMRMCGTNSVKRKKLIMQAYMRQKPQQGTRRY